MVWENLMSEWSSLREICGAFTKQELRTAINETDQWQSDNQASYKASVSNPVKSALTNKQLAHLFLSVAYKKYLVT